MKLCCERSLPLCMKTLESFIAQAMLTTKIGGNCNKLLTHMYPSNAEYYFEDGFRKVKPYFKVNSYFPIKKVYLKENTNWHDVILKVFPGTHSQQIYEQCTNGMVFLNFKQVNTLDIPYKEGKLLTYIQHVNEKAVNKTRPQIIFNADDVVVVDKPYGIPVQSKTCFHNCLGNILRHEYGFTDLKLVHRIDEMTSGIQIYAQSRSLANYIINTAWKNVEKEYIARVSGIFPSQEIICDRRITVAQNPINRSVHKYTTTDCVVNSRYAVTIFNRISTNGGTSLVHCRPLTGRTHQIRVHLQYLGYPIFKDYLYNDNLFCESNVTGSSQLIHAVDSHGLHSSKYVIPKLGLTFKSSEPYWADL